MASTVQFTEEYHHPKRKDTRDSTRSAGDDLKSPAGGVFNYRTISHHSLERRFVRGGGGNKDHHHPDPEEQDEDPGLRNEADYKKRQVFRGKVLYWLAYQSIGVVFGDIGTSPLYVFSGVFTSPPSYDDLVGVLSLVLWTLAVMVSIKYGFIILRADNEGEGGTFSCYSLLSRYANITNRDPREASLIKMERHQTGELGSGNREVRSLLERSRVARGVLKVIGVLAVSMVFSDGVLTPAQSVLGAVQGATVVNPSLSKATIVGTTCAILVLLFLIQPLGTTKVAGAFAPIIIIWLALNAAFGIFNLVVHDHSVLKAFSPHYAFLYLIRNKTDGWRSLGGVLLCFTGVEALFADLGAFSRQAIQLSWFCYAFPCIMLAYIGQAAFISENPSAYSNPFFNAAPPGTLYPALIFAVLAAIVASQAIITATFQIKIVHTSTTFHGQLYVPLVNWLLMIGTVLIAAIYNNTTSLGNAYGVCVMFVTFFDTCMVTLVALIVWRIKPYFVFLPWLAIASMDGAFLSASLVKVPDGAWFTLALAVILAAVFILWRYGKENQWRAEAEDRFPTTHFVQRGPDGGVELTPKFGGTEVTTIQGLGIFFDKAGETTPIVFSQFITKLVAIPQVMVFFHLRPLEQPTVHPEERYTVSRLAVPNCYRLVVRHGYMDDIITPDLASLIVEKIRDYIITSTAMRSKRMSPDARAERDAAARDGSSKNKEKSPVSEDEVDDADTVSINLARLEGAFSHQVLYIMGKEQMRVKSESNLWRKGLLNTFIWLRDNTRTKMASLKLPREKVIEVGFVKDV